MNLNFKALRSNQTRDWQQLRIPLLAITCVSVVCLVGKAVLSPIKTSREFTPFTFPSAVPLPEWQLVQSKPLADQVVRKPGRKFDFLAGRSYQYTQNNLPLDIQMRYTLYPDGEIKHLIRSYTSFDIPNSRLQQRQQAGVGFYGLFVYQGRAYLSACINPQGSSTVTHKQSLQNQISHSIWFERFLPVLLGQESVLDKRCLWAHLSTPSKNSSPDSAYRTLEKAWVSWYQRWKPNFPRS